MANLRSKDSSLHIGWKLDTTADQFTPETLTQTEFTGDWSGDMIEQQTDKETLDSQGYVGGTKTITTRAWGELNTFSMPLGYNAEADLFKVLGAYVTGTTTLSNAFGGTTASSQLSPNIGEISVKSLTVTAYDGNEVLSISGARFTKFSISGKVGESWKINASLAGHLTATTGSIGFFKKPSANPISNSVSNSTLTLDGAAVIFREFELDMGPDLEKVPGTNNGFSTFRIKGLNPKFSITLYPGDPATKNWTAMEKTNSPINLSLTIGSGTRNTYVITSKVQFLSQETTYENGLQVRKIVLTPYADNTLTSAVLITNT